MHWIEMAIGDIPKYYFVPLKYSNSRKFAWKKIIVASKNPKTLFCMYFFRLADTALILYLFIFKHMTFVWPFTFNSKGYFLKERRGFSTIIACLKVLQNLVFEISNWMPIWAVRSPFEVELFYTIQIPDSIVYFYSRRLKKQK